MIEQLRQQFAAYGPNLLAGLGVLVVGWLVAALASSLVRSLLGKTSLDNRLADWISGPERKSSIAVEAWAGRAVFLIIMLVVVMAFLQTVKLTAVTDPLNQLLRPFMAFLPRLIGAAVLVLVAWILAVALRKILSNVLRAAKVDERLGGAASKDGKSVGLSQTFADVVYWLVFLLFLPAILQALNMQSLLEPLTTLFNKVFAFLPNILSAAAILVIGWFIARIVQRILQGLLGSAGVDRLSEKWGLALAPGSLKFSGVLATVAYYVILVPVLISALGALQLEAVTKPATEMLGKMMNALPNIVGALIVVAIAVLIGRIISSILTNVLAGVGFNNVLVKLGLARQPSEGKQSPAVLAGTLCMIVIVLFASVTATEMLGFSAVAAMINEFIRFAGRVFMGTLVFGLGLFLAQLVARALGSSDLPNARRLALIARVVILMLSGAMALRQTGLANEIVNLAFGLTLGAVAVAAAIAFGLGGRDQAARMLNEWRAAEPPAAPKK
jgi:hypothetical protein